MSEAWELVKMLLLLTGGAALWLVMLLAMFGIVLIVLTQTMKAVKEIRKRNSKRQTGREERWYSGTKLRACPYCGEKPNLFRVTSSKKWVAKCWNIKECGVLPCTREVDTPKEAAEIWNGRTADGTTKIYGSSRDLKNEPVTNKHK